MGYQMLNILLDHVQRSQVQEFEQVYLQLTYYKLKAAKKLSD